jgi:hypothetical protein
MLEPLEREDIIKCKDSVHLQRRAESRTNSPDPDLRAVLCCGFGFRALSPVSVSRGRNGHTSARTVKTAKAATRMQLARTSMSLSPSHENISPQLNRKRLRKCQKRISRLVRSEQPEAPVDAREDRKAAKKQRELGRQRFGMLDRSNRLMTILSLGKRDSRIALNCYTFQCLDL